MVLRFPNRFSSLEKSFEFRCPRPFDCIVFKFWINVATGQPEESRADEKALPLDIGFLTGSGSPELALGDEIRSEPVAHLV